MKKYLLLATLLLGLAISLAGQGAHWEYGNNSFSNPGISGNHASSNNALNRIEERLFLLETIFLQDLSGYNYPKAKLLLDEIRSAAWLLANDSGDSGDWGYRRPMGDQEFAEFKNSVRRAVFGDEALKVIRYGCTDSYFSVDQIVEIIRMLVFSDTKLKALEYMYPNCFDKRNTYKILDAFLFGNDKRDAEKIIDAWLD